MEHLIPLKKVFETQKMRELDEFIESGKQLEFPNEEHPIVSIILVLYNRAELTLSCLQSIYENCQLPIEIICIDNNSTDKTGELFSRIRGVKYIKNEENKNFLLACNQAHSYSTGKYLLFLNNDATLRQGAVQNAIRVFQEEEKVGAVGGKIILLDGKLQEAGSICWRDGSCLGYGRTQDPDKTEYNFRRKVNFCSGAFLLTPRKLFKKLGGFDESFAPAYYEETDYCISLQKEGYNVFYEPRCVVDHFEFASSTQSEDAINLQRTNQIKFYDKHKEYLSEMFQPNLDNVLKARQVNNGRKILLIDDRIPHQDLGAGFPRSNLILSILVDLGYDVTVYSLNFPKEGSWNDIYRDLDPKIEVVLDYRRERFTEFLKERADYYDLIWISRPHNFEFLIDRLAGFKTSKIIYDAEAIFSERDVEKSKLSGESVNEDVLFHNELSLGAYADAVVTVKEKDKELFESYGNEKSFVLNVAFDIPDYIAPFGSRNDLLFVGNLDFDDSPNVDSIEWFVNEIFDDFIAEVGPVKLHLVGSSKSNIIRKLGEIRDDIVVHGRIDDLTNIYNQCKVFLAPTRYAAGSPAKVFMAAAHGIPVAASQLIIDQLNWEKGSIIDGAHHNDPKKFLSILCDLYTDENHWNKISGGSLEEIRKIHDVKAFCRKLNNILSSTFEEETFRKIIPSQELEIKNESLIKIKERIDQLVSEKIELQNQISDGERYVLKLLDEISNKNLEIKKRGELIADLKRGVIRKSVDAIDRVFQKIGNVFDGFFYYLRFTFKLFFTFLVNPVKSLKSLNLKNVKLFFKAIKEEPLSLVLSNLKNKLSDNKQ